ncbi:hypothetical protein [Pseudomonas sp. Marseille-QA0892]
MSKIPMVYHRNGYQVTYGERGWLVRQDELPVAGPFPDFQEAELTAKSLPLASWLGLGSCPGLLSKTSS